MRNLSTGIYHFSPGCLCKAALTMRPRISECTIERQPHTSAIGLHATFTAIFMLVQEVRMILSFRH